jgi:hypothetical protein
MRLGKALPTCREAGEGCEQGHPQWAHSPIVIAHLPMLYAKSLTACHTSASLYARDKGDKAHTDPHSTILRLKSARDLEA